MIVVEALVGRLAEKEPRRVERVALGWEDRLRSRQRVKSDAGTEIGIALPTGQALAEGDILFEDGERVVAGTLFGENMPRLVQLGPHQLEAFLDGHLLIFQHSDVPGIIGAVGSICGRHGVNIAQMAVGRASPGGEAIGILNLGGPARESAIHEITGHEAISRIRCIELPAAGEVPIWLEGPKG